MNNKMKNKEKAKLIDSFLNGLRESSFASSIAEVLEMKRKPSTENIDKFKIIEYEIERLGLVEFVRGGDNSTLDGQKYYFISGKGLDLVSKGKSSLELLGEDEQIIKMNSEVENWDKRIFLAHASEDKNKVRDLYKKLKSNGFNPWLDEEDLNPGEKWDDVIKEAIKKSRIFLACLSQKSIKKNGYVQRELKLALEHFEEKAPGVIYFIPTLLEEVEIPNISVGTMKIQDYQAVKIYEEFGFRKLVLHLKKELNEFDFKKIDEESSLEDVVDEKLKKRSEVKKFNKVSDLFQDISFVMLIKNLIEIEEKLDHIRGKLSWRTLSSHSKQHENEIKELEAEEVLLMKKSEEIEQEVRINFGEKVSYIIQELMITYKEKSKK
jgi:TIR domain